MAFWEEFKWLFQPSKQRCASEEENEDDEKLNAIAKDMIDGLKWLDVENSSFLKREKTNSESRVKQHVCEKANTEQQNIVFNFCKDESSVSTDEVSSTKQNLSSQTTSLEDQHCILSKQVIKKSLLLEEEIGQGTVLGQDLICNNDQILRKNDAAWLQTEMNRSETPKMCFNASKYVQIYPKSDGPQTTMLDCIVGALKEYLQVRNDGIGNCPSGVRRFLIKKCAANKNGFGNSYTKCSSIDSCAEINNLNLVSIVTSNDVTGRIGINSQTNSEEKFASKTDCNGSSILIGNNFPLSDDNQDGRCKYSIAKWISSKETVSNSAKFSKEASESGKEVSLSTRLCDINSTEGQKILSASVIRDSKGLPVLFRSSKGVTLCIFNDDNKPDAAATNHILESERISSFPLVFVEELCSGTPLELPGDASEVFGKENDAKIVPEVLKDLRINLQDSTIGDALGKCEESNNKINLQSLVELRSNLQDSPMSVALSKCDKGKDKIIVELPKDLRIDLQDSRINDISSMKTNVCHAENICVDKCVGEARCSFLASKEISSNMHVIKFQNQPIQGSPKFFRVRLFQVPVKAVSESNHPLCKVSKVTTLTNEEWAQLDNNHSEAKVGAQEIKGNFATSESNAVPEQSSINKNEAALSRTLREQDSSTSIGRNCSKENCSASCQNYVGEFITGKKIYRCDVCNYQTNIEISFHKHQIKHRSSETFECEQCKKKFKCAGTLVNHLKHHASGKGENEFECSICSETCADEDDLIAHRKGHAKDRNFKCSVCLQKFSTWRAFKKHKKQPCKLKTKDVFDQHKHRGGMRKKRKKRKKVSKEQSNDGTVLKLTEKTEIPLPKENNCRLKKNERKRHLSGDSELIIDISEEEVQLERDNKKPKTA